MYTISPSTATGVASKSSAPRDCQDPMIVEVDNSTRITPLSGVAMYAIPNLVVTELTKSESSPSEVVIVSTSVI